MDCQSCVLPLYDGEIGIERNRAPLIGRVGFGELRIKTDSGTESYYVDGGFVEVLSDSVSIMTGSAVRSSELNASQAQKLLDEALKLVPTNDDLLASKERKIKQARAQIKLANK